MKKERERKKEEARYWWHMSLIAALERQTETLCEFKTSLVYVVNESPDMVKHCLKKERKKKVEVP